MNKTLLRLSLILLCFVARAHSTPDLWSPAFIETPCYHGGLHGGFTWLYLQPGTTDGDLEAGTLITLTGNPSNLFAQLQELDADNRSCYRANVGYAFPCTNCAIDVNYLHYDAHDGLAIGPIASNQLIQSFLGGSFSTIDAIGSQRINQIDVLFGREYIIDRCFSVRPFFGVTWADIDRKMSVHFDDFLFSNDTSYVSGAERSHYWGVGPMIGTDVSCPICPCLSFEGRLSAAVLTGRIKSQLRSSFVDGTTTTRFDDNTAYDRVSPLLNTQLAIVYRPTCQVAGCAMELKFGYESDYFFKVVDRINPFQGYVVNTNSHRTKTSSNIGLGGPFVALCFTPEEHCSRYCNNSCCAAPSLCPCTLLDGLYEQVDFVWLKPMADNDDLVFGTLEAADGSRTRQKITPDHNLSMNYRIGYRRNARNEICVNYFRLHNEYGSKNVTAGAGGFIHSINSSGNALIEYSSAHSKVHYGIDQIDAQVGRTFVPLCDLQCQLVFGAQYAHIKRKLDNTYSGGTPATQFQTKQGTLKSDFHGFGPLIGTNLTQKFNDCLYWKSHCSLSMLLGQVRSRLDQQNQGTGGSSSNTLRTPWSDRVVPAVDVSTGISYTFCTLCGVELNVEAGYQYKNYYRAINLVYPDFLTGLQQRNSDLALHGPYVSLQICHF